MTSIADLDYWSLLGLPPGSNNEELKQAFRREARRWHPDLNGNDPYAEERFKLVNEAYAILSDPRRRVAWELGEESSNINNEDPYSSGFPDFNDYLESILGIVNPINVNRANDSPVPSSPAPPPVRALENIETNISLTPEQALHGTLVEVELEDGTLIELNTPPFAGDGWRLRLEGVAPGGRDHFLHLNVVTEYGLRIDGLRVHYKLELMPADAALGCSVDVPTLNGPVTLHVPPGSSSGRLLRLRGRGLILDDQVGDQLVEIVIVIPSNLGEAERALYLRLQELALEENLD